MSPIRYASLQTRSRELLRTCCLWPSLRAHPVYPRATFLPRLIWVGLVALFLSVIVAALFAYSIARPLDRIAAGSGRDRGREL